MCVTVHFALVDLMLPGVIVSGNVSPAALGNLQKGDACSVTLRGNRLANVRLVVCLCVAGIAVCVDSVFVCV